MNEKVLDVFYYNDFAINIVLDGTNVRYDIFSDPLKDIAEEVFINLGKELTPIDILISPIFDDTIKEVDKFFNVNNFKHLNDAIDFLNENGDAYKEKYTQILNRKLKEQIDKEKIEPYLSKLKSVADNINIFNSHNDIFYLINNVFKDDDIHMSYCEDSYNQAIHIIEFSDIETVRILVKVNNYPYLHISNIYLS